MSLDKYQQIINKNADIEVTFEDLPIETYHRLAYLNFVKEEKDIDEIDKIFHFIAINGSFFSQLTHCQSLAQWVNFHLFHLKYDIPQIAQTAHEEEISLTLKTAMSSIAQDLNLNIVGCKMTDKIETILNLANRLECKQLQGAAYDLKQYIENFDDMDGMVYLYQTMSIVAVQVLSLLRESNKN